MAKTPEGRRKSRERQIRARATERGWWRSAGYKLKSCYGIGVLDLASLYFAQWWRCAGCLKPLQGMRAHDPDRKERDHIDHCHAGGGVRGILCAGCNLALGGVQDSLSTLERLRAYLTASRR